MNRLRTTGNSFTSSGLAVSSLVFTLPFLSSLTLFAYLKVFRVYSQEVALGEIIAIMQIREFDPKKKSLSTNVSLLPRKGRWAPCRPSALMHSFKARRALLISAPSIPVKNNE